MIDYLINNKNSNLNIFISLFVQIIGQLLIVYTSKKCNGIFIIKYILYTISLIFLVQILIKFTKYEDPLEKNIGIYNINYWSITHYLCYVILMLQCNTSNKKDLFYLILKLLIFGIFFELFESKIANKITKKILDEETYWYGQYSDIVINLVGMLSGIFLSNKISNK